MRLYFSTLLVLCLVTTGCNLDNTITHGADGTREWDRKLKAAVPVGLAETDCKALMERNGFSCENPSASSESLWCDKQSTRRLGLVKRRWQATFDLKDGRVVDVHSATNLIGP